MRIIVVGSPRAGKTTWALDFKEQNPSFDLIRGDDYISPQNWSSASEVVSLMLLGRAGPWVAEGTVMTRAMDKLLAQRPDVKPCDKIVWFHGSRELLKPGQSAMGEAIYQWMSRMYWPLKRLDVEIEEIVC